MTERSSRLSDEEIKRLVMENARLNKTVQVLMERVERDMDQQRDSFSLFQTAINLEKTVELRTRELKILNARLREELDVREKVEDALRIAKQQAEDANLSKTKFLATASHDLRQPLNAARLFLETLEAETDDGNEETVQRISTSLDALDDLLSVLLNISQLDAGGIKPNFTHFRVQDLLDRIVPEYIKTGETRGLDVRMVPCSAVIYSDERLLETIIRNFLSNAVRYTKRGRILVGCRHSDDGIMICVHDTGIGIREDKLEAIFEEFTQVHEDRSIGTRGIGLGLSIVDRITRLLGLPVHVASVEGKGSRFAVTVHKGEPAEVATGQTSRPAVSTLPDLMGERVIVVTDNDPQVLEGMEALLRSWGCRTVAGASAEACLVNLISNDLEPAMIIADYHLDGGVNGLDAAAEIQAEFEALLPVLIITSDRDKELADRIAGKDIPLLYKPVKPARLSSLIHHSLSENLAGLQD
ncbi:hybrid sensor histidine kinase/response regulator [Emcibacter nanhaiensis]|uniref:histidine kinase n=1 Tax=Emcibacter nanhaiensis TaxID=1505037 RepID=A0A501PGX5_9PROT|nr:hybrid sensor histidine kinase/response regulator [Emcibacter nanhaiensis]TPD59116.1 response regulator [Emcibacter nanhaiensis]